MLALIFHFARTHGDWLLTATILALMALQLFGVISRKSITNDEIVSIPAGYYHLADGNFQISIDHPPPTKMLAALPLLLIRPATPEITIRPSESAGDRTVRTQGEFWEANRERFLQISFWARVPAIGLTVVSGVLIFICARRLFGARAAVLSVFLFSLEPTVLAHGRTALNDLPAASAYLLFFFTVHLYLTRPDLNRTLALGLASGLALVMKFSMIVIAPIFVVAAVISILIAPRLNQGRTLASVRVFLAVVAAIFVINAVYYFEGESPNQLEFRWLASIFSPSHLDRAMLAVRALSKIVPSYFLAGLDAVLARNKYGPTASLLGRYSDTGWWYYFPVAFALKTTLPFLILSVAALGWALWKLFVRRESVFLVMLIPVGIYLIVSLTSHLNIGIRHFLPVFPFLFILSGALLDSLLRRRRARRAMLIAVIFFAGWIITEAVRAYPDHMSYMNELTWRHPRWYYLSDSNVEWGDDVPELASYLLARGETKVRAALLGGWSTLPRYGVGYVPIERDSPETRYIAIGASFLNGSTVTITKPGRKREDYFAEFRNRTPEAVFGNSIYLFREK